MIEPQFDFSKRARKSDPDTSKDAALKASKFASGHWRLIRECLENALPWSMHFQAIAEKTGLEEHAVARRLKELETAGLIERNGTTHLRNGNRATLWRAK